MYFVGGNKPPQFRVLWMRREGEMKRSKPKRKKPLRKRSKGNRIVKECDALVRERVFERDGRQCVRCGSQGALGPSHVYPKGRYQNLRWLEINILTMDWACHRYWWHDNPVEAFEWFAKTYPDRLAQLKVLKDTMEKPDLRELKQQLLEG